MPARPAYVVVSVIVILSLALAIAPARGQNSLDMALPSSYIINGTKAYDTTYNGVDIWGPIEVFKIGGSAYVSVPTNAPAGSRLAFFQDAGARFRNNTLVVPIGGPSGPAASMALMTMDLASDGKRFCGQVTDVEVDTMPVADGDAVAGAVLYLNEWPGEPSYRVSISINDTVKRAVADQAARSGEAGSVRLMLDVEGDSISYAIVRMKAPEASGNVSAYRYSDGTVTRLACKAIRSNESVVYETISGGGGTFAFVGPFLETPPARAEIGDVLLFAGALGAVLLLLVGSVVTAFRKLSKKS